jgi:fructose-1,6-bisphosphatase II
MNKIVTGPEAAKDIDLQASTAENIAAVARAKNLSISDITVVVLNRPRHETLISEIRKAGARIRLIQDGDVAAAIDGFDASSKAAAISELEAHARQL